MLTYLLIIHSLIGLSQSGKITVRKAEKSLLNKTLQLNDMRGAPAGLIYFKNKEECTVTLKIEIKNSVIQCYFKNKIPAKEKLNCSYSIINDTILLLKHKNYSDTCYYNYTSDSNNLVQLKNTLHGVITRSDFAICYHFDSILYSQTFNKSQNDSKFTDNIDIDSIYQNVKDKKLKRELENTLQEEITQYKNSIRFNYFKGKYKVDQNSLKLYSNNINFASVKKTIDKKGINIYSTFLIDGSKPLVSQYTHNNYGTLNLDYDSATLLYFDPKYNPKKDLRQTYRIEEGFKVKHISSNKAIIFNNKDTFDIWQNENYSAVRIENSIGGFYRTHLKSLNNNTLPFKKMIFTAKNAFEINNEYDLLKTKKWNYKITDSALFVFNQTDTLIDELKNSWKSFSFTYKNNEPLLFGIYHHKINMNKHQFIILFNDKTGVKYKSSSFNYKKAREIYNTHNTNSLSSKKYRKFNFSASKDYLWLDFEDGKYQKLSFFNYNKALREINNEVVENYYLIE
jgi:hypothetical protein